MLYEQIDAATKKRMAKEIKIDLKFVNVTLRDSENATASRSAKLQIVERYVDTYHNVGSVGRPGTEFFKGQLDMEWGWALENGVWFSGVDSKNLQIVVLGGSRYHMLGEQESYLRTSGSSSSLPVIVEALAEEVLSFHDVQLPTQYAYQGEDLVEFMFRELASASDIGLSRGLRRDLRRRYPRIYLKQRFDFYAIPLLEMNFKMLNYSIHAVLGTPLYVALAQRPGDAIALPDNAL
jgi:hypothetical protein